MKISYKRNVTVLLLLAILTKNVSTVYLNNSNKIREQRTLAKEFTTFLRVPWINLNSTWADQVTSNCRDDVITLFENLEAGKLWALQMLDASSKLPSGILTGNIRDLGMYDECVKVRNDTNDANIQGQHCLVSLSMPTTYIEDAERILRLQKISILNPSMDVELSLSMSVCLPSTCGVQDIFDLVNASIEAAPKIAAFDVKVVQVMCSPLESERELPMETILAITFFAVVAAVLIFCTICDFVRIAKSDEVSTNLKIISKFSLYANALKILSTEQKSDSLSPINGIRFLSACLIVFGHGAFFFVIKSTVNLSDLSSTQGTFIAALVLTLIFVVDTFFIISGFLLTYLFLKAMHSGQKLNIFTLYIRRFIRVTPSYAVTIFFVIFIFPYLGSGPHWASFAIKTSNVCRKNWRNNILSIQNYIKSEEMCVPHTWYLAADTQLYFLSPIILYPLFYRPKLGLTILGIFSLASIIIPPASLAIYHSAFMWDLNKRFEEAYFEGFSSYLATHMRSLPYFLGMLLGYEIFTNKKRRISEMQVSVNWVLTIIFVLFCVWSSYYIQPNGGDFNMKWELMYVSVTRLGWDLAMCWIIYACLRGYGGPVTSFLSSPIFGPLSRLTYCLYLVHFIFQTGYFASETGSHRYSIFNEFFIYLGQLIVSLPMAFLLSLCFESPIIALEKLTRTQQASKKMA